MEDEFKRLMDRFSFSSERNYPQIMLAYQQLRDNPRRYFEELTDQLTTQPLLAPQEYFASLPVSARWRQLSSYSSLLSTNYQLDLSILKRETDQIHGHLRNWQEWLSRQLINDLEQDKPELPQAAHEKLYHDMYHVALYLLQLKVLALIEDEMVFFTEIMELGHPDVIVYYADRLISLKSKLQLQKYMLRRVYSDLPEDFDLPIVHTFLDYFKRFANLLSPDQIHDLIRQIERFKIGFRKKTPTLSALIAVLGEKDVTAIKEQVWSYPRIQVRNLFIPHFVQVGSNAEIRRYWDEHHSDTSKNSLLSALHGVTTDPFFFEILFDKYPRDRRSIIISLTQYPIEDREGVVEFLKSLPDRYQGEVDAIFNSYWRHDYQLLYDILDRLDDLDPAKPVGRLIRAKYRLAGLPVN